MDLRKLARGQLEMTQVSASASDTATLADTIRDLRAERDLLLRYSGSLNEVIAERDALRQEMRDELAGNAALRKECGAEPHETMWMFVHRLLTERDALAKDARRYSTALFAIEAEGWKGAADEKDAMQTVNHALMWELARDALEPDFAALAAQEKPT